MGAPRRPRTARRPRVARVAAPPAPPWAPAGPWAPARAWCESPAQPVLGCDPALAGPMGLALVGCRGQLVFAACVQIESPQGLGELIRGVAEAQQGPDGLAFVTEADAYRNRNWQLGQAVGLLRGLSGLPRAREVRTSEWRKWAYGWLPERDEAKKMAVLWAAWRWGQDLAHDAAEAAIVAAYWRATCLGAEQTTGRRQPARKKRAT